MSTAVRLASDRVNNEKSSIYFGKKVNGNIKLVIKVAL
jgi:hypothetical protein